MDPKLKKQLFIRKHFTGIITILAITLILPLTLILAQSTTQYQQQAAGIEKNTPSSPTAQDEYTLLMKCFDKPKQTNHCTQEQRKSVDLNDDGVINGIDYNLYVRKTAGRKKPQ